MMETRAKIVAEARSWIGTPFHHNAEVKGAGVDCAMLLKRVYIDLGLIDAFTPLPYAHDWHLHRDEEKYLQTVLARAKEVDRPQPGDVALFRVGRCYSHGAIVTGVKPLAILHAFMPAKMVIEEEMARNPDLIAPQRKIKFFSVIAETHLSQEALTETYGASLGAKRRRAHARGAMTARNRGHGKKLI